MSDIDTKELALVMMRAFRGLLLRYMALTALLEENGIQASEASLEEYLKDHPSLSHHAHNLIQPVFDAVEKNQDLESVLIALRDMLPPGPVH